MALKQMISMTHMIHEDNQKEKAPEPEPVSDSTKEDTSRAKKIADAKMLAAKVTQKQRPWRQLLSS